MAVGGRSRPPHLEPGWALTGGRERNVAIAAATAVDAEHGAEASVRAADRPRRPRSWPRTTGTWPSWPPTDEAQGRPAPEPMDRAARDGDAVVTFPAG